MINRAGTTIDAATLASCRIELDGEIERFIRLFGPIKSWPRPRRRHARVPGVHNGLLMRKQSSESFHGVVDCNEAMRGRKLGALAHGPIRARRWLGRWA